MGKINSKIYGIKIIKLNQLKDERGAVFHYLKNTSECFNGFGEAYFSKVNSGIIKGWKYHEIVNQNICVPFGKIKMVFYDNRTNSKTRGNIMEIEIDDNDNYNLIHIPTKIWYSFKSISNDYSLLANIIDQPHNANEAKSLEIKTTKIPYDWD